MRRNLVAFVISCVCWLYINSASLALEPNSDIHELQHTGWTIGDGAPPDIWGLAQGPDGFLWLATGAGLYRFDGVTFERINPVDGKRFPSLDMTAIAVSPKGEIWIGYFSAGFSEFVNGRLRNIQELNGFPVRRVWSIDIDRSGDTWIASDHGLFRFHHNHWDHIDQAWNYPYGRADFVHVARNGTIWVTGPTLVYLQPGTMKFKSTGVTLSRYTRLAEDRTGRMWVADRAFGILPVDQALKASAQSASHSNFIRTRSLMFDDSGVLWGTDADSGGLFRVHSPDNAHRPILRSDLSDKYGEQDGLTSDIAAPMMEDSEGDVWVGTNLGLNRFRTNTFMRAQGMSSTSQYGYCIATDEQGDVLTADADSLYRISGRASVRLVANLPFDIDSMIVDRKGTIWITAWDRTYDTNIIAWVDHGNLHHITLPTGSEHTTNSIIGLEPDGGLIVGIGRSGINILKNGIWTPFGTDSRLRNRPYTVALTDSRGRIWIGFSDQTLAVVDHGSARILTAGDSLPIGNVTAIAELGGRILLGGEQGLAEYDGTNLSSISADRLPGFSGITGVIRSRDGAIWTNGILGIVRVPEPELQRAFEDSHYMPRYRLFDYRDGVIGMAEQGGSMPTVVSGRDGTLWFITNHGIISVNPLHLNFNTRPPQVSVLSMTVEGQTLPPGEQTLPAAAKEVRIDYTATSLQVPERVRFRYMLEGFSSQWTDPGRLRQAYFTNLPPGRYRFRVIAANNDGVWNTNGASISFIIPPTFLQSWLFTAICALTGILILGGIYRIRLKQMACRVRSQLEERIRERERIARELHDTLLQSVQGLILRLHAAVEKMQAEDPGRKELEITIQRADRVTLEARERVRFLRATDVRDLLTALREAGEELAEGHTLEFRMIVEGAPRELHAIVCEELTWIGREALTNAFTHSNARQVVAEISYHRRELRLQLSDDGQGLPEDVAIAGGRAGHFGLVGFRERAKRIRGRLTLHSGPGIGTALTVVVPADVAYKDKRERWGLDRIRRLFVDEIET
jgi:ligand-binding sensor domain-containing protein